jgi:hypothetical protein
VFNVCGASCLALSFTIAATGDFSEIIKSSCGEPLTNAEDNVEDSLSVSEIVDNEALLQVLHQYRSEVHPLIIHNAAAFAQRKFQHHLDFSRERDFIVQSLCNFSSAQLQFCDPFIVEGIS